MIRIPSTSNTIVACVDGSPYTDSVCAHAAWASHRLNTAIRLLHVQASHPEQAAPADLSGAIGLGARSTLLEKLAQVDEERAKLDLQKGKLILEHAKEQLAAAGAGQFETLHRRGSLVETLADLEPSAKLLVIGKRGEHADFASVHLGSNLERVARAAHKPLLVCSRTYKAINRFVIAYDGGTSTQKAVDYVASSPLLRGLECHLLQIGTDNEETSSNLAKAAARLKQGGFNVQAHIKPGHPDKAIAAYIESNAIDLLVMGAYGHSRIRVLILGSTTSTLLRSSRIPVLMFR
jgi:nucleotide-binding universal stress UspA family protein